MSKNTLGNLQNYSEVSMLQRAFLIFIANRLPPEELEKYKKIYHKLQKNKCFNSVEAFSQGMSSLVSEAQAIEIFKVMDLDGTKRVYWSEFLAAVCSKDILMQEQNLKEAF
jgi:Ca2+-binding EF-hand superfamily protein